MAAFDEQLLLTPSISCFACLHLESKATFVELSGNDFIPYKNQICFMMMDKYGVVTFYFFSMTFQGLHITEDGKIVVPAIQLFLHCKWNSCMYSESHGSDKWHMLSALPYSDCRCCNSLVSSQRFGRRQLGLLQFSVWSWDSDFFVNSPFLIYKVELFTFVLLSQWLSRTYLWKAFQLWVCAWDGY